MARPNLMRLANLSAILPCRRPLLAVAFLVLSLASGRGTEQLPAPLPSSSKLGQTKPIALTRAQRQTILKAQLGTERATRILQGGLRDVAKLSVRSGYVSRVAHLEFVGGMVDYRANAALDRPGGRLIACVAFQPSAPGAYLVEITMEIERNLEMERLLPNSRFTNFRYRLIRDGKADRDEPYVRVENTESKVYIWIEAKDTKPIVASMSANRQWAFHAAEIYNLNR